MSNLKVSILGCGWLGKPLGTALVNRGCLVLGSTTKSENIPALEAAGIVPHVFNVNRSLAENAPHQFFHCDVLIISLPHGARRGKSEEYASQIKYVMDAAHQNTRNIILISTTSVYQNLNRIVREEDADKDNAIVRAEKLVRESGISNTILRFAGLFGPGRHPGRFLAGKKEIKGGNVPVNMIHLDDCIEIIMKAIQQNVWNEVLNACADDHPTRKMFYTNAAAGLGVEPPVFLDEEIFEYKVVSNERLKAVLNYQFIHKLV
jgi:nucleoside-diphosphate-sugar epimerase